jgi:hypothetical protein
MVRQILGDERDQDELDEQVPGTTVVLTSSGWESAAYVDPGDDWRPLEDGSWVSTDGLIRSWPVAGPGQG